MPINTPNARGKILKASAKVFAEKGFEGSRINEISKEAGVPKSLIYYHFESKEKILEVLTENFINDYSDIMSTASCESHPEKSEKLPERMKNEYYEFGIKNSDLVRVMFIDSLKKIQENPVIYKVLETIITNENEGNKGNPISQDNIHERRIAEFFTSLIPCYAYICFCDSWTKYFNIEKEQFDKIFMKVYKETHGAYHKNHK